VAVKSRLLEQNPFSDLPAVMKSNPKRYRFISREDAAKVLDACPSAEWRPIFALARYGGLRVPSEVLRLRWGDIDWHNNKFTVTSPKTEHHEGGGSRVSLIPFSVVDRFEHDKVSLLNTLTA
jgi:integrase